MRPRRQTGPRGFTLIELAIVILIIGIIMGFILVVSFAGIEQARVRSTQALITKLEMGINDRLTGLLSLSVSANGGHRFLAAVAPPIPTVPPNALPWGLPSDQRAQVIARIDQIKREIPDVFFIQNNADYPVNFAGQSYFPSESVVPPNDPTHSAYPYDSLPIGHRHFPYDPPTSAFFGDGNGGYPEGVFGASNSARAALYQVMGLMPEGCDGADNNDNGLIDEIAEGTANGSDAAAVANLERFLANHRHNTARSEILYALLVEGQGALGAVFNADDFTSTEVLDTDGDGLPEFVDAWGQPLQFFRWPIYFATDGIQKGSTPYFGMMESREQFPLDPNNLLQAPAWWGASVGTSSNPSVKVDLFQQLFTGLRDPNWASGSPAGGAWDRSNAYGRRAFYCRFLILSGGPDLQHGMNMLADTELSSAALILGTGSFPANFRPAENHAAWNNNDLSPAWDPSIPYTPYFKPEAAEDNIDNLGIQSQAGGAR